MVETKKFRERHRLLIFSVVLITTLILLFVSWRLSNIDQQIFKMILNHFLFEGGWGVTIFVCIYAGFIVCLLPTLPLNVIAGYIWGGWVGGLISCVAATSGSWISFSLSKTILHKRVYAMPKPVWFEKIEQDINKNDWRYLVFVRLNPIFPSGPINYLVGLTTIKNLPYVICTFFPLLIPSILIAFAGSTIKKLTYSKLIDLDVGNVVVLMMITSVLSLILIILKRRSKNTE